MKLLSDVILTLELDTKTHSDTPTMRCVNLLS